MSRLYEAIEHYQRKLPGVGEVEAVIGPAAALAYYLIRAPEFYGYYETLNAIRTSTGKVAVIEWIRAYKTRTGDGDRVLQAALDDFARKGVSRVFLLPVADELQAARIRFFERHGFHTLDLDAKKPKRPMARGNPQPVRRNRTDLAGRHVPEKYLEGLPPELQRQRLAEFTESRDAYHRGEFGELPTDKKARELGLVKLSAYRVVAMQRGFDVSQVSSLREMAENALRYYGDKKPSKKVIDDLTAGLEKVYQKGLAAWQSGGHRPGATGQNWADARVASVLVGGKAAWTADNKQFNLLPAEVRRELIAQLPDVYAALTSQGRKHDVEYIQSAASNPRHLSAFYAASSIYRWPFGLRENEKGYPKPYSPQNPINRPWEYLK